MSDPLADLEEALRAVQEALGQGDGEKAASAVQMAEAAAVACHGSGLAPTESVCALHRECIELSAALVERLRRALSELGSSHRARHAYGEAAPTPSR